MPDDVVVDATKSFLDVGVVGAVCVLLMAALVWRELTNLKALKDWQDKYQAAQDGRLADAKAYASSTESLKATVNSAVDAMKATTEFMKEGPRR